MSVLSEQFNELSDKDFGDFDNEDWELMEKIVEPPDRSQKMDKGSYVMKFLEPHKIRQEDRYYGQIDR